MEYYPLMTRADGRGLERLDLNTLEVIIGGRGDNPKSAGFEAGTDNFAPRLGAVYRLNQNTVLRAGYGVTFNNMGWGRPIRGDLQYPITLATTFTQPLTHQWYNRLGEGIPSVVGPDQSSGRVALPNSVGMTTPELGNVDRADPHVERGVRAAAAVGLSVDVAYVGAKGVGGTGGLTPTCRRPSEAARRAVRAYQPRASDRYQRPGARSSTRTTTRCRLRSTGHSSSASC